MADPAPPIPQPAAAPPVPAPGPEAAPQADLGGIGNAAFGKLADGGFMAKLGSGLLLSAEQLASPKGVDLSVLKQPLPGVKLTRAVLDRSGKTLTVSADLAVPYMDSAKLEIKVGAEGKPKISGKATKELKVAALHNPTVTLTLSEDGAFGGSVKVSGAQLLPEGIKGLTATGDGEFIIQNGIFSGSLDATLAYPKLGSGEVHLVMGEGGKLSGGGSVKITPPFLNEITASMTVDEAGNLNGTVTVAMTEAKSPIPALSLTGGSLTVGYQNGAMSGALTGFQGTYRDLANVTGEASIDKTGAFAGAGEIVLTVPGLNEARGKVQVKGGKVSGELALGSNSFPEALGVKGAGIVVKLSEAGTIGFSGKVQVALGPAGSGDLTAAYSETGQFSLSATITLTVPGLQSAQVTVNYVGGDISGEGQLAIDPGLIPGITGNATVRYKERLWSGETELGFSADNGKLNGKILVTVAQTETGALQLGGTGQLEAQIAPRLRGMLTATILPQGGVDVSGRITVTEPLELFPEKRFDKELFKYSQNIPLWAILVAVIRVRAGIRGGIGAGVFRNIVVEGSYTIGSEAADPTFSISGEMFIPAFIEAYVAFGAGLGLDVVIGELTGGIEGVATAGLYGAISVVPELSYADGDWSIEGDATLAAGARLKVGLNAWAEVEAFWVTVWEETWKLGEWVWNVGPDLALNAHMAYHFGQPGPPEVEFKTSDIDSASMIQEAMPKDGPAPSGAKAALDNKAEWKGKLKEQKQAAVPPALAAQQAAPPPAPPAPAKQPKPKSGPPPAGAAGAPPGKAGALAPGAAPGAPGAPPPGSPGADKKSEAAATPDPSVKGTVPASQVPGSDKPRYPTPISLKTLDEPPAMMPRTPDQQNEDVDAAKKVIELAITASDDTEVLDDYFPRIKNRFQLSYLGYVGDAQKGISIQGGVNPTLDVKFNKKIDGTGIAAVLGGSGLKSDITHGSNMIDGTEVGVSMHAKLLGPDHRQGSEAGGQDGLMDQLPVGQSAPAGYKTYIRGHLLNAQLGGEGKSFNLFPITSQANSQHHADIEDAVKEAVNTKKYWVEYKVTVKATGTLVDLKAKNTKLGKRFKAIDSTIDAEASYVTTSSNGRLPLAKAHIQSIYPDTFYSTGADQDFAAPDPSTVDTNVAPPTSLANVAQDPNATPRLLPSGPGVALVFPEFMRIAMAKAHQRFGWDETKAKIGGVAQVGKGDRLERLYDGYTEAQRVGGPGDRDISALNGSSSVVTQVNYVKGLWSEVEKVLK